MTNKTKSNIFGWIGTSSITVGLWFIYPPLLIPLLGGCCLYQSYLYYEKDMQDAD